MRPRYLAAMVALSVIWGSAFMLVKVVLEEVDPLTLVAGRLVGGFLVLAAVLLVTKRRLPMTRQAWLVCIALGLGNNVWPFILLTWGQEHIESSLAAILTSSMALSTALLAHFWIRERLTLDRTLGLLVGFAGVFVLIGGSLSDISDASTLGQIAVLAGVLGYSFGTVLARRYLQDADGIATATGQTLVASLVMVPLALGVDRPFHMDLSVKHIAAWVALGVLSSGLAYILYFWLVRQVTATQASMVGYLIPITAVFVGALVLNERLSANSFVGLAIILAGVWIVNGGWRWLTYRRRETPTPALGAAELSTDERTD
jgi:drug/metabolite transporter (DMT)-like permease